MFVLLLKYHALQLFVDLLSNHQLTKLNILVEFCCSLCAFPVPLAQPLLLFHYPSHGHIRARAKQRHWLESQNVLTADLSFWWFRSCTFLDTPKVFDPSNHHLLFECSVGFREMHLFHSPTDRFSRCNGMMPGGIATWPREFLNIFWSPHICSFFPCITFFGSPSFDLFKINIQPLDSL